jgi:uncharacterized membrane protein YbhN (UPF0104 family)
MKLPLLKIVLVAAPAAVVGALAAVSHLLGDTVSKGLAALHGADSGWLALAAILFGAAFLSTVGAWRTALAASGGRISSLQASARIGVGALVNTFAPAKLGDAVKIALCSRAIEGPDRIWTAGGVYAGLGAARGLTLAGFVVAGSAAGALPLWPVFVLIGGVAVVAVVALSSSRWRSHHRIAHLLEGFAALERSPRAALVVLGWTIGAALARFGATAAVAAALGFPHPLLVALVILPAIDLAGFIPVGVGNVGVASGAVAVALQSRGISVADAVGAAIAIQALETLVSILAGTLGGLYLVQPRPVVRRWTMRTAAVGLPILLAGAVGALVLDLV